MSKPKTVTMKLEGVAECPIEETATSVLEITPESVLTRFPLFEGCSDGTPEIVEECARNLLKENTELQRCISGGVRMTVEDSPLRPMTNDIELWEMRDPTVGSDLVFSYLYFEEDGNVDTFVDVAKPGELFKGASSEESDVLGETTTGDLAPVLRCLRHLLLTGREGEKVSVKF